MGQLPQVSQRTLILLATATMVIAVNAGIVGLQAAGHTAPMELVDTARALLAIWIGVATSAHVTNGG